MGHHLLKILEVKWRWLGEGLRWNKPIHRCGSWNRNRISIHEACMISLPRDLSISSKKQTVIIQLSVFN